MTTETADFDLDAALENIGRLSPADRRKVTELLEKRQRLTKVEGARQHFLDFVKLMWPDFIPGAHHTIMAEAFERVANGTLTRLIINMPPRHALEVHTEIPTTTGWKTMAELQPGDWVYGPDGKPTKVLGKSEVHRNVPLYRATTSDGASLLCDAEHLWSFRNRTDVNSPLRTKQTKDLVNYPYRHGPYLPRQEPVAYPELEYPIDPYVLGAWLGDGASASGTMAAHPADAPHIRARFEAAGVPTTTLKWAMTFGTKGLRPILRGIGVLHDKHIPEPYLWGSVAQRMALLQGLMDTDGDVTVQGKCTFNNTNRRLARQVVELLHSLGVKARLTKRQTSYKGKPSSPSYRVMFRLANAASLPRKAERTRAATGNWARSISFVEEGRGDTQCIRVDREDGLFLAGRGYIVTHNTKSELTSWLLPAWFLGRFPKKKIIQASNTEALAAGFGRRVRNLISDVANEDDDGNPTIPFSEVFPRVALAKDSQSAAGWHTNRGGEYFAIGVNGKVTGKGGDIVIIDDPHSEQEARQAEASPDIFDNVYEWYTSGPRQRLQPGGAIIIVMTRWSKRDLTGQVLKKQANREQDEDGDKWEVINFPAILDEDTPNERSLWPAFWPLKTLKATRAELPVAKWKAQYCQNPTSEEGAIIKREHWRRWGLDKDPAKSDCPGPQHASAWRNLEPPACHFIMLSIDTALKQNERADYSAFTTWGVFEAEDSRTGKTVNNLILLSAWKARLEFPELKKTVRQFYFEDNPDAILIEDKGSGTSLIQELRSMDIPVSDFNFGRGKAKGRGLSNDKIARANMVTDIFASGYVWAPERRFADECIEECAEFPYGEHDDYVDTVVQALLRFRKGGLISTANDAEDEDEPRTPRRRRYY